jgi:hypothetical protein
MKILTFKYLPSNFYLAYSVFILIALLIGPVKYANMNYQLIFLFLLPLLILFQVAFIFGAKGKLYPVSLKNAQDYKLSSFLKSLIYLGFVISLKMWFVFIISGKSLSLSSMGENYVDSYDGYVRGNAQIGIVYLYNIFESSFITISLLIIFTSYSRLKGKIKLFSVFIIFTYVLINVVGSGKQKYLGDVIIFILYSYFLHLAINRTVIPIKKVFSYALLFTLVLGLFSYILSSRYSALGISGENIIDKIHPLMYWDKESMIIVLFGDTLGFPLGMFLGYFSNGLYGLNLAMQLPFEWTYFLGNSYSLSKIVEVAAGEPGIILDQSYPFRAESVGWGLGKWHSLFSWLASDFTFPGVIVLGGFFGFVYGRIWLRAVQGNNYFAKPLFVYLSLGVVFSFSNNQIMHTLSGVITLFILSFFYYASAKRKS